MSSTQEVELDWRKICDELNAGSGVGLEGIKVISEIGEGNMGKVYLIHLTKYGNLLPLAMKVVKKEPHRMHRIARAKHEAQILSTLNHPFLPTLISSMESPTRFFILTNYCPGGDLHALRHKLPHKKYSENATRFYAAEVLVALEYLHGIGIVYRDLKPENILIGENGHIVLTDFDRSVRIDMNRCSIRSLMACSGKQTVAAGDTFVGTDEYVAPEALQGRGYGCPLDWWTFGIFVYEMLFGKTPFEGRDRNETFSKILRERPRFPGGARRPAYDLISRLLEKDPSRRLKVESIKEHPFFHCIRWSALEYIQRPPFIPSTLSFEGHLKEDDCFS